MNNQRPVLISRLVSSGILLLSLWSSAAEIKSTEGDRCISGVYPHLTAYAQSRSDGCFTVKGHEECGIGAIVPWAGRLWMMTYAPHRPHGSQHKLYSIDEKMKMTVCPESVGGTPAARMIHWESEQLIIGPYFISKEGKVRVISPQKMPGRLTAIARHLSDPANRVYVVDMEDMVYEVNVHTLAVTKLFNDPIPGYHGKGAYTAQGRLVVANNGETSDKGLDNWESWQVSQDFRRKGPEDRGCLATFDGKKWEVIERRQYTEVTGPGGIYGNSHVEDPLWTVGWDKRALRLQVLDGGQFHTYLLPKGSLNNDASHGWFTEWPRIREVGGGKALLDMHGMFFDFPLGFKPGHTAGLQPIGRHLRYIPDFCDWNGRLVIATDETSIQGNPMAGQPQSNLWFGHYDDLKTWGEASAAGSIWVQDKVQAGVCSSPFLVKGFKKRVGHFCSDVATSFTLEMDRDGDDHWKMFDSVTVNAGGYKAYIFPRDFDAQWIRVKADKDCLASVAFSFADTRFHNPNGPGRELFAALAEAGSDVAVLTHLLYPSGRSRNLAVITPASDGVSFHELNAETFEFKKTSGESGLVNRLAVNPGFTVDAASVVIKSEGKTLRLPKGNPAFDKPFSGGWPRSHREVESERLLANIHGTLYEVPFWIVGQPALYTKMKPICSHNKQIMDFASWRGLLILSGVKAEAIAGPHVFRSADGGQALWAGGIDDLWQLGKPVGEGGPWKNSTVKAGVPSDAYLMNGYDHKTLTMKADRDCVLTLEVDFDLQSGFHRYKTFVLKAGEEQSYEFPDGFAAHWARVIADHDCVATAWFIYR